jgi:hypothetical protein
MSVKDNGVRLGILEEARNIEFLLEPVEPGVVANDVADFLVVHGYDLGETKHRIGWCGEFGCAKVRDNRLQLRRVDILPFLG